MTADLVETMQFDPLGGLIDLQSRLARMSATAQASGFSFDNHNLRNELQAATFRVRDPADVVVRVSPSGATAIIVAPRLTHP